MVYEKPWKVEVRGGRKKIQKAFEIFPQMRSWNCTCLMAEHCWVFYDHSLRTTDNVCYVFVDTTKGDLALFRGKDDGNGGVAPNWDNEKPLEIIRCHETT